MSDNPIPAVPIIRRGELSGWDREHAPEQGAILLVDKPLTWTSFDVVAVARGALGVKKVGHAGTLDPLATGLLILCLGRATRLADHFQAETKEYTGTIRLGATTATEDAEGEEENVTSVDGLDRERIDDGIASFLGTSLQMPPMFSARKVDGQRLYKLARKGIEVERPERPITIDAFEITRLALPHLDFRLVCSKGTYVRAIARDLGARLGVGGYLAGLRRTKSGGFTVDEAASIEEIRGVG